MYYITATLADKLLPVASRGDIEGAFLALALNSVCLLVLSISVVKIGKLFIKAYYSFRNERTQ